MAERAKITQEIFDSFHDVFLEQGALKAHFHCRFKKVWNHTRPIQPHGL